MKHGDDAGRASRGAVRAHENARCYSHKSDEGGWHTGVWFAGVWRLHADIERVLDPTHWLPAPPDVVVK